MLQESKNLCSHSAVKSPRHSQGLCYVKDKTAKKPCMNGEYGSLEHLVFLLTHESTERIGVWGRGWRGVGGGVCVRGWGWG